MSTRLSFVGLAVSLALASAASAQSTESTTMANGIQARPNGVVDVGVVTVEVTHFNTEWAINEQHDPKQFVPAGDPQVSEGLFVLEGDLQTAPAPLHFVQRVETLDDGGVSYHATIHGDQPVETNVLAIAVTLLIPPYQGQTITIDGEPFQLPNEPAEEAMLTTGQQVERIEVPVEGGTLVITGDLTLVIQDNRQWDPEYVLRLYFDPAEGPITDSAIDFQMRVVPSEDE